MRNILFVLVVIAIMIVGILAYYKSQKAKQECLDSGGWINEYNCGEYGCSNWSCIHV